MDDVNETDLEMDSGIDENHRPEDFQTLHWPWIRSQARRLNIMHYNQPNRYWILPSPSPSPSPSWVMTSWLSRRRWLWRVRSRAPEWSMDASRNSVQLRKTNFIHIALMTVLKTSCMLNNELHWSSSDISWSSLGWTLSMSGKGGMLVIVSTLVRWRMGVKRWPREDVALGVEKTLVLPLGIDDDKCTAKNRCICRRQYPMCWVVYNSSVYNVMNYNETAIYECYWVVYYNYSSIGGAVSIKCDE